MSFNGGFEYYRFGVLIPSQKVTQLSRSVLRLSFLGERSGWLGLSFLGERSSGYAPLVRSFGMLLNWRLPAKQITYGNVISHLGMSVPAL